MVPEGLFRSARTGKARRDTTREKQYAFAKTLGVDVPPTIPETPMAPIPPNSGYPPPPPPRAPYPGRIPDDDRMNIDTDPIAHRPPPSGMPYSLPPAARPPQNVPQHEYGRVVNYPPLPPHERLTAQEWPSQGLSSPPIVPVSYQLSPSRLASPVNRPPSHAHPYAHAYTASHMSRTNSPRMGPQMSPMSFYQYMRPRASPTYSNAPGPSTRHAAPRGPSYTAGAAPPPPRVIAEPIATRVAGPSSTDVYQYWAAGPTVPEDVPHVEMRPLTPPGTEDKETIEVVTDVPAPAPPPPVPTAIALPVTPDASPSERIVPLPVESALFRPGSAHPLTPPATEMPLPQLQPPMQMQAGLGSAQTSPVGHTRELIPLDDLGTALFPRRDPADDALLRRFRGLRTTPPQQSPASEM